MYGDRLATLMCVCAWPQVWDMLPGGLTVVGLYVVSDALSSSALARLRSLIPRVCAMSEPLLNYLYQPHSYGVLLHLSTATQRYAFALQSHKG